MLLLSFIFNPPDCVKTYYMKYLYEVNDLHLLSQSYTIWRANSCLCLKVILDILSGWSVEILISGWEKTRIPLWPLIISPVFLKLVFNGCLLLSQLLRHYADSLLNRWINCILGSKSYMLCMKTLDISWYFGYFLLIFAALYHRIHSCLLAAGCWLQYHFKGL